MNTLDIMNWARDNTTSLPIAIVIYHACRKLSKDKQALLGAMADLLKNPTDAEFSLITKMALCLPEARGLDVMWWGDREVTR